MSMTISNAQVGARVAAVRRFRGISQSTLAKALEMRSTAGVSNREKGRIEWTVQDVARVAEVLGVPVSTLLEPDDDLMKEIIGRSMGV